MFYESLYMILLCFNLVMHSIFFYYVPLWSCIMFYCISLILMHTCAYIFFSTVGLDDSSPSVSGYLIALEIWDLLSPHASRTMSFLQLMYFSFILNMWCMNYISITIFNLLLCIKWLIEKNVRLLLWLKNSFIWNAIFWTL